MRHLLVLDAVHLFLSPSFLTPPITVGAVARSQ
jgi:hypothetical protein